MKASVPRKNMLYTLGPMGLTVGPCPVGWWIVLSSGWQLRYERVWWRIYRRVEKVWYPIVLRPEITGGYVGKWKFNLTLIGKRAKDDTT